MEMLYYGDNLEVLRASIADESIDLIYLHSPFNSQAQITAFTDTWQWGKESVRALEELKFKRGELAELLGTVCLERQPVNISKIVYSIYVQTILSNQTSKRQKLK